MEELGCVQNVQRNTKTITHLLEKKEVNPSKVLGWERGRAKEEMDKCILLCANCHRMRHFNIKEGAYDIDE